MTNHISIEGNVTRDLEIRQGKATGTSVVAGAIAYNHRKFNKETDQWEDTSTTFVDFVLFGEHGEHVAASIGKGDRVLVVGQLQQDHWENDEGEKRSKHKIVADSVTPVLRWAEATVAKTNGGGGSDAAFAGVDLAEI